MNRSTLHRLAAGALLAGVALSPADAAAQSASTAVAEALFQQARDLFKQEHYAEACPKFAESQRLDPKLGTLLNLAVCNEKLGKIATAWAEYTSAAAIAHRDGQGEREGFARDQIAALEKKLPRVIFQVGAPDAGLRITWDDEAMAGAVLGTPFPVDPGKHRITATAPGKKVWSSEIAVPAAKGEVLVPIPVLQAAEVVVPPPTPPPVGTAPPPATTVTPPPVAPPVAPPPSRPVVTPPPAGNEALIAAYTGFSVGGLGVVVGTITGILALTTTSTIRTACGAAKLMPPGVCPGTEQGDITGANTVANVSNVSFAVGAVGLGVGIVGLLMRPRDAAPRAAGAITPIVGPGFVGASGTF